MREKEYSTFDKKVFNLGIITHKAIEHINKTTQDILDKKFPKIPYNKNICGLCEFKNYCWGIQ